MLLNRKIVLLIACVCLFLCIITLQDTYAKYTSAVNETTDISIARWRILVNNYDIRSSSSTNNLITPVFAGNANIASGVIAPTAQGYFDVVVDAFGAWTPETLPLHSTSLKVVCDALSGTDTRLLVVGGAGSLYVNPEHTMQLYQTSDFPEDYKIIATAQVKELDELRKRNDVKWTFVSPAGDFQADGKRTGKYILAGEEFTLNSKGESVISYADYAIAMIDEAVKGNHIQQRISVVRE